MTVDWKAFMRALRIVDEGIERRQTPRMTPSQPRKAAARRLQVHCGECAIETERDALHLKLDQRKSLETASTLVRVEAKP